MFELLWVDEGPLRKKIGDELNLLSRELRDVEAQVDAYFSRDLPQYQAWMGKSFSEELSAIADLEKRVHEMGFRIEESIQLGMQMDRNPAEVYKDFRERGYYEEQDPEDVEAEIPGYDFQIDCGSAKGQARRETKEVYRRIIRRLHPDLRGVALDAHEKDLWVRAQKAYGADDLCELLRLEECLDGDKKPAPLCFSHLLRQARDLKGKLEETYAELILLRRERAWNFSGKKNIARVSQELETELQAALKELKQKQMHFCKTFKSWEGTSDSAPKTPKRSKRASKLQASFFND